MKLCSKCHKNPKVNGKTNSWCKECWNKHQHTTRGRSMQEIQKLGNLPPVKVYQPGSPEFDRVAKEVTPINEIKKERVYIP